MMLCFVNITVLRKGGESEHFAWMYIINSGLGVVLDEHIYLYRYNDQIYNDLYELIPWAYGRHLVE